MSRFFQYIGDLAAWKHTSRCHSVQDEPMSDAKTPLTAQDLVLCKLSLIGHRGGGGWTCRIGVKLASLQQFRKLPKRRSSRNTSQRRGTRTSAVLFSERRNVHNGSVPPVEFRYNCGSRLTSLDLKAKLQVVRLGDGWQVYGADLQDH